ncbi:Epidermal growth factor-like domain-containing protein [Strongyloides ratti]|uniref:Epidermal growth factor-like domain-containing protein n=1 Tax=Strongyloides ratti TaxID=34506 RepID=A0A090LJ09_STRRB|nr:Epidermal growth factor-like domain-containing protein [Strongyloides ratti]CEF68128.1 Epidermal growth factor-like domain-containing protein [Strongyloides ratti]
MILKGIRFLRTIILVFLSLSGVYLQRHKNTDSDGENLEVISLDTLTNCTTETDFGLIDGYYEECGLWEYDNGKWRKTGNNIEFEEIRCKHNRINGIIEKDICVCKPGWSGAFCHIYDKCEKNLFFRKGRGCTNICENDGILSRGNNGLECSCKNQWDGRWCERLACWRLTPDELHSRRYVNSVNGTCKCSDYYSGPDCLNIVSCIHGKYENGYCKCHQSYHGEICDIKCKVDEPCIQNFPEELLSLNSADYHIPNYFLLFTLFFIHFIIIFV